MNELRSLANLLSVQKLKQIDIVTENDSDSKTGKLLNAIRDESVKNDEEAMSLLYPNINKPEVPYAKLKYRLKQRLINTLFFIDIQQYSKSPYEKALFRTTKHWAASQILYTKGQATVARDILESQLKTCLKYDLTELSLSIIQHQKYRYGLFQYDKRKHKRYKQLYKVIKEKHELRVLNEDIYVEIANKISIAKNLVYDKDIKALELELLALMPRIEKTDEYFTKYYSYNSLYFLCMFKKDLAAQAEICDRALSYFKTKKGFTNLGLFSFSQKKGIASLALKKYDLAIAEFDACFKYRPPEGGLAWQYLYGYKYLAYIMNYEYLKAYETTSLIMNNKKAFKKIRKEFMQQWHLKEAFIHFLIQIGKIDPKLSTVKPLRKFRLRRFLNEVVDIAQDKQGVNITINILQLLFLLLDKKYDLVLDKINALKQYSFRHLKDKRHIRAKTFIKMLQKVPAGDYNPSNIFRKTDKDFRKLQENPMSYTEDQMQLEIIPYEQMWRELLEVFDRTDS